MSKPQQYAVFITESLPSQRWDETTWCRVSIDLDEDDSFTVWIDGLHPDLYGVHIIQRTEGLEWKLIQ
jgi:hypothetical protein